MDLILNVFEKRAQESYRYNSYEKYSRLMENCIVTLLYGGNYDYIG